jgi:hypothetical protein
MRLPWGRRAERDGQLADARQAVAEAKQGARAVEEREPQVRQVVDNLREIRQSNHFSERLAAVLREYPRGHHAPHS